MSGSYQKFKNTPNYRTASRKFDCSHLDKFIADNEERGYTKTIQSQTPALPKNAQATAYSLDSLC